MLYEIKYIMIIIYNMFVCLYSSLPLALALALLFPPCAYVRARGCAHVFLYACKWICVFVCLYTVKSCLVTFLAGVCVPLIEFSR